MGCASSLFQYLPLSKNSALTFFFLKIAVLFVSHRFYDDNRPCLLELCDLCGLGS